ncbi:YggS family pyridoxal phosphate-dependent enzyme [Halorhodospira halochloris]|uniref:YggS family pyridoxal phosphate-dependent enzyme n=1 Tax=Halorhodospira halochloris TaxID=1052 RepID=UPI001EE924BC|nr:YggS family pyridoxal phosphate-dependent enzyme [Halorhodospira halochloris]MCG5529424.1 YggS family pyridoxal phosphate-dependent enzyme [Halorhodospira halochloris]
MNAPNPDIATNLERVIERIRSAEVTYGRTPNSVSLLAVSKRQPVEAIRAAYQAGQLAFGENYLQEAAEKQSTFASSDIEWHLIGSLQSNKTRAAATSFDWVHTIDRAKIAQRLSDQRPDALPPINICLQVNISEETQKAGCPPVEVLPLAAATADLPGVSLRGLMAIPEPSTDCTVQRRSFAKLRKLYEQLQDEGFRMDTLSMGMSLDLDAAIAEGANYVRVGTAIFGPRNN